MARTIEIDQTVTISTLAKQLELPSTSLVAELFKNGIVATLNEKIDFATATGLIDDLGLDVTVKQRQIVAPRMVVPKTTPPTYQPRPPVVAVMGHVDHGKTTLIDKITQQSNADQELGGITQHINAYQAQHDGQTITFLDTPGHVAFASLRQHGIELTDLVVIVVAADDGVRPQTIEAIRFAQKPNLKIIVAISKVDKAGVNVAKVRSQLAEHGLVADDAGGDTSFVELSATTGTGIKELLDIILLTAQIAELKADVGGLARGLIIESYLKKGLGPVAVVLVQEGILKMADFIVAGQASGRVRTMNDFRGQKLTQAGPSMPVMISGFKALPKFSDHFFAVENDKTAKKLAKDHQSQTTNQTNSSMTSSELLRIIKQRTSINRANIIIKADVQGSLTTAVDGVLGLDTDEVGSHIVAATVGEVSERDIWLAKTTQATIHCFNVTVSNSMKRLARRHGVTIDYHTIIYEFLMAVKQDLEKLLPPEVVVTDLAQMVVKGVFKTTKDSVICGGQITSGQLSLPALASLYNGKQQLATDLEVISLKKETNTVNQIAQGELGGVSLRTSGKLVIKPDHQLHFYRQTVKVRKL